MNLFLEHLGWINRVAAMTCSQHGIWGAEAEDFAASIRLKLIEDDYAIIRKHRGEASLKTYLATVVVRQFHDYLRETRGRWRPSAAARRLGPPAAELEALVYRDGYRLDQAGEMLRTSGRTELSDRELGQLLKALPERAPQRPKLVSNDAVLDAFEGNERADDGVINAEAEAQHQSMVAALWRALARLDPADRQIVRMHFQDGRSLADVARALRLEQKPLYRRVNRVRELLRKYLELELVGNFSHPGILGPDGLPIRKEDLQGSRIITDIGNANEKILRMVRNDPKTVYGLSPRQFEELVAALLDEQGYEVRLTPPSRDGGFDMYAAKKDGLGEFLYLVECKRYRLSRPVGVNVVRQLHGVAQSLKASAGIVVTTSRFTRGAREFQQTVRYQLSLRDYLHLRQWLGVTIDPLDTGLTGAL
jgi:RNA polymerase sigma factor (sigma-70 family)